MVAMSETVSRVKGFKPVVPHTMDPTNLYIKGLPSNADESLGHENWQLPRYVCFFLGGGWRCIAMYEYV